MRYKGDNTMQTTLEKEDGKLTIAVSGRVDTTNAPEFEKCINENTEGITALVLDVAEMKYVSSAGLRVFLKAQKKMDAIGSMKIINVQDDVMEIFDMIGFSDILNIE